MNLLMTSPAEFTRDFPQCVLVTGELQYGKKLCTICFMYPVAVTTPEH